MHLYACNCVYLYITFYFLTQGPPGLAGAKGEKVNFLLKFLIVSTLRNPMGNLEELYYLESLVALRDSQTFLTSLTSTGTKDVHRKITQHGFK